MDFSHKNEHVRSHSIYEHDPTLKIAFGAKFFFADFNEIASTSTGSRVRRTDGSISMDKGYPNANANGDVL